MKKARGEIARHSLPQMEAPEIWKMGKVVDQMSEIPSLIKLLAEHYEQLAQLADKIRAAEPASAETGKIITEHLANFYSGVKDVVSPEFLKTLDAKILESGHPWTTTFNRDGTKQEQFLTLTQVLNDIELFWQRGVTTAPRSSQYETLWNLRSEIASISNSLKEVFDKHEQSFIGK